MSTTTDTEKGYVPTLDYLAWVARQVRIDGSFMVGKETPEGGPAPTWQRAIVEMDTYLTTRHGPKGDDTAEARATLDYFRAMQPDEQLSDYLIDLIVLLRDPEVRRDRLALAASGLLVYQRQQAARERQDAARRMRQQSRHVGRVGDTIGATVTVEQYAHRGHQHIYTLRGDNGNAYTLFWDEPIFNLGWVYAITAKVTRHDTYRGEARTVIGYPHGYRVIEEGSHAGPKVGE